MIFPVLPYDVVGAKMIEDPLGGVILIGGYSVQLGTALPHFLRLAHAGPGTIDWGLPMLGLTWPKCPVRNQSK